VAEDRTALARALLLHFMNAKVTAHATGQELLDGEY
jgi:hypothetical protein